MRAAHGVLACAVVATAAWPLTAALAAGPDEQLGPTVLHMPHHERHAEQGILRPVPLVVELPSEIAAQARRVLVHYRLWGDPDWTTLELAGTGLRREGAIPCLEVSTVTGDLRYYIRVHDAEGHVLATAASRAAPYIVTIRHDDALAPGAAAVQKCPDPANCPPGMPGCPSERVVEIACAHDEDCEGDASCSWRGFCERVARPRNWLSLAIEQDFGLVDRAGACSVASQEQRGYICIRADGVQYLGNPVLTNEPIGAGPGPTRVVIGYDRLLFYDTSVGVRVGFAVAGAGPATGGAAFVPLSASVRATHWFGEDPFADTGLRGFLFLAGGYAMFDVETKVRVREDPTIEATQGGNDLEQSLDLFKRAGDGFLGGGGGIGYAWSSWASSWAELSLEAAIPFGAFVLAPSAVTAFGF